MPLIELSQATVHDEQVRKGIGHGTIYGHTQDMRSPFIKGTIEGHL
jgi:hypothetical protein